MQYKQQNNTNVQQNHYSTQPRFQIENTEQPIEFYRNLSLMHQSIKENESKKFARQFIKEMLFEQQYIIKNLKLLFRPKSDTKSNFKKKYIQQSSKDKQKIQKPIIKKTIQLNRSDPSNIDLTYCQTKNNLLKTTLEIKALQETLNNIHLAHSNRNLKISNHHDYIPYFKEPDINQNNDNNGITYRYIHDIQNQKK